MPTRTPLGMASLLASVKLLLHLATNQSYGFHRDELYFIVSGSRLAAGYVDQGPLVPAFAALARAVGGDSLAALRFLPAVAGALTVFLTCWLAALLGGGRFSQVVTGMAVLIAPAYLRMHTMLHIPTFESLFWALGCVLVALILKGREPRLFLLVGAIAGLGLLNKPTMLLFGAGLLAGLAVNAESRWCSAAPICGPAESSPSSSRRRF
jgi:4-amino-4-deoxy-L-arabinose transferase-like glycosyltransferase